MVHIGPRSGESRHPGGGGGEGGGGKEADGRCLQDGPSVISNEAFERLPGLSGARCGHTGCGSATGQSLLLREPWNPGPTEAEALPVGAETKLATLPGATVDPEFCTGVRAGMIMVRLCGLDPDEGGF